MYPGGYLDAPWLDVCSNLTPTKKIIAFKSFTANQTVLAECDRDLVGQEGHGFLCQPDEDLDEEELGPQDVWGQEVASSEDEDSQQEDEDEDFLSEGASPPPDDTRREFASSLSRFASRLLWPERDTSQWWRAVHSLPLIYGGGIFVPDVSDALGFHSCHFSRPLQCSTTKW